MEKKKCSGIKGFILGVVVTILIGGGIVYLYYGINPLNPSGILTGNVMRKARVVEQIIDENTLEEPDPKVMEEGIYAGMVAGLQDPYSYYISADEYQAFMESATGTYKGIGVVMVGQLQDGMIKVDSCYPDTPGDKAGILPGDYIIEMDGESLAGVEPHEFGLMVREREEGEMTLLLLRDGEEIEVKLTPEEILVPTLSYEMMADAMGYIRIGEFTDATPSQFKEAYEDLNGQNMKGLIVDLRNNPGGMLNGVCDTLEQILPEGLIVYTEDAHGNRRDLTATGKTPIQIPLVVLINGESASASEIFAGAVKDHEIGTLVGETTFGKGIVQSTISLSDGSAVKLTTSKYFTPNGNNIHGIGINPDVEVPFEEGENDNQLDKAVEVLKEQMK